MIVTLVATAFAAAATAHPAEPALTWEAPPECPASDEVERKVAAMLAPNATDWRERVRAHLVVTRVDERLWRVDILIVHADQEGRRRIEGRSCQSIAEAAALVVALTIDPTATLGEPVAAVGESAQPRRAVEPVPTAPSPAPRVAIAPANHAPSGHPVGIAAAVALGVDSANAASPTAGLEVAAGVAGARLRVDAVGSWWLPQEQSTSYDSTLGVRFSMMTARLRGCAGGVTGRARFGGCAAAELTFLRAEGRGVTRARTVTETLPALSPLAFLEWPLHGDLRFRIEFGGAVNMRRPAFEVTDELVSPAQTSRVHTVPPVSARLALAVVWAR